MTREQEAITYFESKKKGLEDFREIYPSPDTVGYQATTKEISFYDMAISALSAEGEYIKKADMERILYSTNNAVRIGELFTELPTYTIPNSAEIKGEWIPVGWIPNGKCGYPKPEDEYKHFLTIDNKGEMTIQEFLLSFDEEPQPYFSGMRNIVAWMPLPEPYKENNA